VSKIAKDNLGSYDPYRAKKIYKKDEKAINNKNWIKLNEYVIDFFSKNKCENVLDVGCGTGRFFKSFVCKNLFGVDLSEHMLSFAEKTDNKLKEKNQRQYENIKLLHMDIIDFCQEKQYQKKFDFIFSAHTLYTGMSSLCINDVIRSLPRVARAGAKMVLDVNYCTRDESTSGYNSFDQETFLQTNEILKQMTNLRKFEILQGKDALAQPGFRTNPDLKTHVTIICDIL
tara:strand:+ start:6861 stop:7547 length:687 start_codon:yes stop_codon:yes gene_type:complete